MPMHIPHQKSPGRERGVASLLISLIILALITIVTLYTSKSILTEQKLTNNNLNEKRAFEITEAGLNTAIHNLNNNRDLNNNGILDGSAADPNLFDSNNDGLRDSNTLTIGSGRVTVTVNDISTTQTTLRVHAIGVLGDNSGRHTMDRVLHTIKPIALLMENPLTARGTVTIHGSATIRNPEGHTTIWSGSSVDLGASNSTATTIIDIDSPNYPACQGSPSTCSTIQPSNKTVTGLDIIERDANLAHLTPEQLFMNYFGSSRANYRESRATLTTNPTNTNSVLSGAVGKIIWVDGHDATTTLSAVTIGSATHPVVLIIDGNASLNGNSHLYGLLFVNGNLNISGDAIIEGAAITTGDTNATGNLDIRYNSALLRGTIRNGPLTPASGSWSDI